MRIDQQGAEPLLLYQPLDRLFHAKVKKTVQLTQKKVKDVYYRHVVLAVQKRRRGLLLSARQRCVFLLGRNFLIIITPGDYTRSASTKKNKLKCALSLWIPSFAKIYNQQRPSQMTVKVKNINIQPNRPI